MKRAWCRERNVPANRCCNGTTRIVIAPNPDPGAGGRWAAGCAAARKDLDNDHATAAASLLEIYPKREPYRSAVLSPPNDFKPEECANYLVNAGYASA
jgi:hypothetical protein